MSRIKVLVIFGTRPEAIKMAPVVKALEKESDFFETRTLVTGQHREMLDQVLDIFGLHPDYDLDIMLRAQSISDITRRVMDGTEEILKSFSPDILLVHGDTTTSFAAALTGFYHRIPIGHVEAGLRSYNRYSPFPEEMNRTLTGQLANLHFAPTKGNEKNLINENIDRETIFVTGNTVIDALLSVVDSKFDFQEPALREMDFSLERVILLTAHRRENFGPPMEKIFRAVRRIAEEYEDVRVVYPMHLNPGVRAIARGILGSSPRVHLIEPLEYLGFAHLMKQSFMILTDSGGIQEEAPALGKPVLVLREETERPEAVAAGTVKVVGTEEENVYAAVRNLLENPSEVLGMTRAINPYGEGRSAQRIVSILKEHFKDLKKRGIEGGEK
ncbi:MAG: UDP-N-acetyl glucosamine 2-epimerase [delta proteobacterium ML8_F1]|nr:MAG: UDP-N-acetyl glucosamine 2-epimerase [delta proteobacterium ML8_F1]